MNVKLLEELGVCQDHKDTYPKGYLLDEINSSSSGGFEVLGE